ncbi:cyclic nucleotide-binding/CBS domain-containing protein [Halorussus sp. MSC15.2]|uniref:CBS domain-containing protein n=1 Tax=Halorussus sp. MSC15.2 TaxID=2283638 RepID=UPI0013D51903|nr:CBS domain-containing protein [Halorussus sp. MSC15.2]NEU56455.1 CBS domain-containing protein [Halorussus sp. MSC15.2]
MEGEVTVRDVMSREYVGVSESDTVLGAVRLMHEEGVGCVVVLRGSEPVGIVTESDVIALVAEEGDPAETDVSAVMSEPIVSVDADLELPEAAGTMSREDIRRLLVTNDAEVVGVLSERDVISASASLSGVPSLREETTLDVGTPAGSDRMGREPTSNEPADAAADGDHRYEYSDRSICETCGTLSRELTNVNGQLICVNCRNV